MFKSFLGCFKSCPTIATSNSLFRPTFQKFNNAGLGRKIPLIPRRTLATMSGLTVELTAPNGRKYVQPTGLFINNEWVPSSDGEMITSINPSFVHSPFLGNSPFLNILL
jgi:hypothetical protein